MGTTRKIPVRTQQDKNNLLAKSAFVLPDNPSSKNFSASQIRNKLYEAYLVLFEYLKMDETEINRALGDVDTAINNIINGTTVIAGTIEKARADYNGNPIHTTYETKADATTKKTELDTAITNLNTNKQNNLDASQLSAVNSGITSAKLGTLENHVGNANIHVTTEDKEAWSGKAETSDIPAIVNDATTADATKTLSANVGKLLQDQINELKARGRFLSDWNATTGQPTTQPTSGLPYTYKTGDYFIVTVVGDTNYKPNGSQYTGSASTTVETNDLSANDTYIYDGTVWILQRNTQPIVAFSNINGNVEDNAKLVAKFATKQDEIQYVNVSGTSGGTLTPEQIATLQASKDNKILGGSWVYIQYYSTASNLYYYSYQKANNSLRIITVVVSTRAWSYENIPLQQVTDNSLTTTSKYISGAINELNAGKQNTISTSKILKFTLEDSTEETIEVYTK